VAIGCASPKERADNSEIQSPGRHISSNGSLFNANGFDNKVFTVAVYDMAVKGILKLMKKLKHHH